MATEQLSRGPNESSQHLIKSMEYSILPIES